MTSNLKSHHNPIFLLRGVYKKYPKNENKVLQLLPSDLPPLFGSSTYMKTRRVPEKRRRSPTRATIAIEMSLSRVLLATTTFLRDRFQSILSVYWPQRKKREKTDMLCNSLLLYSITPNTFRLNTYWAFFLLHIRDWILSQYTAAICN